MIKKTLVGAAAAAAAMAGMTGIAGAHIHSFETPGGNTVTIPCEPFHGTTPGASHNSANWDATRGLHPIHHGLHTAPAPNRPLTFTTSACPS